MVDALSLLPSGFGDEAPYVISIFPETPDYEAAEEMLRRFHAIKLEAEWCIEAFGRDSDLTFDGRNVLAYAIGFPAEYRREFRNLVKRARRRRR